MTRRAGTIDPSYFDDLYASDPDPWRFATSDYERDKYDATIAALSGRTYPSALEIGCSIGILSRRLASHCQQLQSVDTAAGALDRARAFCADQPHVSFALGHVPRDWPSGQFDLILLSEVVYYLDANDVGRLAGRIADTTRDEADIVLVHWIGPTDYPMSGDAAVDLFLTRSAGFARILRQSRTTDYRLDVLRVRSDRAREDR